MKDYYSVLGVSRDATEAEIQRAFRKLAQQHHPDKKGGDAAKFKEANEAYQVLNNKEKRAQYDQFGSVGSGGGRGRAGGFNTQGFGGFDFSDFDVQFSGGGGDSTGFADAIRSMFYGAMNRGEDIQADIVISFETAVFGGVKKITIPYRKKKAEEIEINIPAGVESGMKLRLTGKGEPAKDPKLASGDLYIRITVNESKHFRKMGGDIIYTLALTPTEALLGAQKEIPDIRSGTISVKVPELSKDGTAIGIPKKGIPQPAGTGRIIVVCAITYPKKMTSKARKLFEELKKEGW